MILRFSARLGIKAVFAANRPIPGLPKTVFMEICPPGEGEADNRIAALAQEGDLVLTRDLPLAERLIDGGIAVMDDRGRAFTKENIRQLRSLRDFTVSLAENGLGVERTSSYGKNELKALANGLDRELSRLTQQPADKN
jgi:hypothetical protein